MDQKVMFRYLFTQHIFRIKCKMCKNDDCRFRKTGGFDFRRYLFIVNRRLKYAISSAPMRSSQTTGYVLGLTFPKLIPRGS